MVSRFPSDEVIKYAEQKFDEDEKTAKSLDNKDNKKILEEKLGLNAEEIKNQIKNLGINNEANP